ncbi:hydroxylamine oxidase [bacterium]|nr:hydroxylamine oxidase [bacterium]
MIQIGVRLRKSCRFPWGWIIVILSIFVFWYPVTEGIAQNTQEVPAISEATQDCLGCHEDETPGIVADWRSSRHAIMSVSEALKKPIVSRRVSAISVPESLSSITVGCYECHGLNPEQHQDNFDHNDYKINTVVTPPDCSTCHPTEVKQFAGSKKANAIANLEQNPLFHQLTDTVTGQKDLENEILTFKGAAPMAKEKSCFACHGTHVTVKGLKTVQTEFDEVEVPDLTSWPNQGVGRHNPDGSFGACTACHPRHSFSIETARKPYTCAQCHLAPDVPAWEVFKESKHGNIFMSQSAKWNWTNVPWRPGEDFKTPTCSSCHNALLVNGAGNPIVERTHDFGSRLWVRIFGLPYTHAQPKEGGTFRIKNADGLPLPITFDGKPASSFLITEAEQQSRQQQMKKVCGSCHGTSWNNQFFSQMDRTNQEVDHIVKTATQLVQTAWKNKLADPSNPFDEELELMWVRHWLFYGSSARYGAAMSGPDYVGFKYGWWDLTETLVNLESLIKEKEQR